MRARGFTLVEVMVALAVVAIALPALLVALYRQIDDTAYLRDKTMAHMVAANKLEELRLSVAATRRLQAGKSSGSAVMAERDWFWWWQVKTTEVDNYFRIEIDVAMREERRDNPIYTLVAFMSGDLQGDVESAADNAGGDSAAGADTGQDVPAGNDGGDA
jgi:general secretion pathway protein I